MQDEVISKICSYIHLNFRPKFKSNRDFALHCDIDEKTVRLIQQEKSNLSLKKLKQICDAMEVKMSFLLLEIGE